MSDSTLTDQPSGETDQQKPKKLPYDSPAIVWEEDYRPTAFGLSCAKQPGNPPCIVGPVSN